MCHSARHSKFPLGSAGMGEGQTEMRKGNDRVGVGRLGWGVESAELGHNISYPPNPIPLPGPDLPRQVNVDLLQ